MPPLVTVLIPVRNAMPYLADTLASLERQTWKRFTVHIWDNGSTDGSVDEMRRWIPGRIPGKITADRPLELHLCLSTMVAEAETDIVARLDGDDICEPERFGKQHDFLSAHPEMDAVGGQMNLIDTTGKIIGRADPGPTTFAGVLFTMIWRNAMPHPAMMFRRAAAIAAGNYRAEKPCEDYDLWMRMCTRGQMINLPDVVLNYRIHANSVVAQEKKMGVLLEKMSQCVSNHADALFGLSRETMLRLVRRKHGFVVPALQTIVAHVAKRTGTPAAALKRSPDFLAAARMVYSPRDILGRIYLKFLHFRARG